MHTVEWVRARTMLKPDSFETRSRGCHCSIGPRPSPVNRGVNIPYNIGLQARQSASDRHANLERHINRPEEQHGAEKIVMNGQKSSPSPEYSAGSRSGSSGRQAGRWCRRSPVWARPGRSGWEMPSDCRHQSTSNKHGHWAGHITRRVWSGTWS